VKISHLELFKVPPRWLFLKITTDDGLAGWGEPIVEGRADTVAAAVTELGCYLEGRDPNQIEDIWQVLYRGGFYRGGPVLMSAIAGT
jgi:galactonate dehydratase